jgi:hypothetical protein
MRLVYKQKYSGQYVPVQIGDDVVLGERHCRVTGIEPPHHSGSTGRVYVAPDGVTPDANNTSSYFPSVIDAEWIEREDRDEGVPSTVARKYGWSVGDYAVLKVDVKDEILQPVPAGSVIRIEAISPRTTSNPEWGLTRGYFYNACRIGDKYPRLRQEFDTIRVPTKGELVKALREFEERYIDQKLIA